MHDLGVGVCKLLEDDEATPYHANLLYIAGAIHSEIGFSGHEKIPGHIRKVLEVLPITCRLPTTQERHFNC